MDENNLHRRELEETGAGRFASPATRSEEFPDAARFLEVSALGRIADWTSIPPPRMIRTMRPVVLILCLVMVSLGLPPMGVAMGVGGYPMMQLPMDIGGEAVGAVGVGEADAGCAACEGMGREEPRRDDLPPGCCDHVAACCQGAPAVVVASEASPVRPAPRLVHVETARVVESLSLEPPSPPPQRAILSA